MPPSFFVRQSPERNITINLQEFLEKVLTNETISDNMNAQLNRYRLNYKNFMEDDV